MQQQRWLLALTIRKSSQSARVSLLSKGSSDRGQLCCAMSWAVHPLGDTRLFPEAFHINRTRKEAGTHLGEVNGTENHSQTPTLSHVSTPSNLSAPHSPRAMVCSPGWPQIQSYFCLPNRWAHSCTPLDHTPVFHSTMQTVSLACS